MIEKQSFAFSISRYSILVFIAESSVKLQRMLSLSSSFMQQIDNAGSSSSSSGAPTAKTSGQQQICVNQSQSTSSVVNKTATSTVVSVASLVTTPTPVTGKAAVSGILPSCLSYRKLRLCTSSLDVFTVKGRMWKHLPL